MRPVYEIAEEIENDWERVDVGARGALVAMHFLTVPQTWGRKILREFLANAQTYRGGTAERVKSELREML